MGLEAHEAKALEERFERLETKLKTTFLEVERRFAESKTQPQDLEARILELEDLILLMQLEITKVKDRTSVTTEFLTPQTPDLYHRLNRVEEALGVREAGLDEPHDGHEEPLVPSAQVTTQQEETVVDGGAPRQKSLLAEVQKILSG